MDAGFGEVSAALEHGVFSADRPEPEGEFAVYSLREHRKDNGVEIRVNGNHRLVMDGAPPPMARDLSQSVTTTWVGRSAAANCK
jgi:hypothetical protein